MTIAQRVAQVSSTVEAAARSKEFAELVRLLLLGKGNPENARHYAGASSRRVQEVIKTAITGLTDLADIAPYQILSEGFSATLSNAAFDAVLADSNQAPLRSSFAVTVADATAATAGSGAAKRLSEISFGSGALDVRKAAAIVAVSDELLRFNSAVRLIENALRNGVANAVDSVFVTALIASTTPVASTGATAAAALHDIRLLLDGATVSSNSRFHLLVSPATCARLAVATTATVGQLAFPQMTPTGGVIGGIQVHASNAITNTAVLIDASQVVAAADPVSIRISPDATLEMTTAPTQTISDGSPLAPTATNVVSMFQTDSTAVLCERQFGWSLLRASAVQSLSGVAWAT